MGHETELQTEASATHGLSSTEGASLNDLLYVFGEALEYMPYLQFELVYTRTTDWMVHIYNTAGGNSVKVSEAQEVTREDACRHAAALLRHYFASRKAIVLAAAQIGRARN